MPTARGQGTSFKYRPNAEGGDGGRGGGGGPADDGGHPDVAHPQQEVLKVQVQDPGNAIQCAMEDTASQCKPS